MCDQNIATFSAWFDTVKWSSQYYTAEHSITFHGNFVRLSIHYFNLAHNISLLFPITRFSFIEKLQRLTEFMNKYYRIS